MTDYRSDQDYDYDYDEDPAEAAQTDWEPPRRSRGRLGIVTGVVLLAFCGFGGIVWYAYSNARSVPATGEPPLIEADAAPVRVRPEQPGGLEVPHQDRLVLQQLNTNRAEEEPVEHLLPPPEEPLPRPEPQSGTEQAAADDAQAPLRPAAEPDPAEEGDADLRITAEGPGASPPAAPATPEPANVEQLEVHPVPPPPQDVAAAVPAARPPASTPPASAPASGGYRIQMAAVRSEEGARSEWQRLQRQHPDLLGALQLQVQRVDLGSKGIYFRVQGGPLSEEAADTVCSGLKSKKVDCIVVRP